MAVTYDQTQIQTNPLMKLRFLIGDTVSGRGPRPNGRNFDDAELQVFLDDSQNDVYLAAAMAAELLSTEWASAADISFGPRRERLSQVSRNWERKAKRFRAMRGGAPRVYAAVIGHNDAYENASSSTEYGS